MSDRSCPFAVMLEYAESRCRRNGHWNHSARLLAEQLTIYEMAMDRMWAVRRVTFAPGDPWAEWMLGSS